jgi:nucleotide-binding universal stress UspA family protein
MKSIIAAVDFSPVSEAVISMASSISRAMGGKLWLVHIAAPDPDFVGFKTGPQYIRDHRAEQLRKEHGDLQAMAAALRDQGADAEALLVQGPTAETLLEEAARLGAELIIVGAHGRGMLHRALLGSVSEQVVRESRVPVLVVPAAKPAGQ